MKAFLLLCVTGMLRIAGYTVYWAFWIGSMALYGLNVWEGILAGVIAWVAVMLLDMGWYLLLESTGNGDYAI